VNTELLGAVREGWGWTGIDAAAVTAVSPFGHLIVRDAQGAFWYLDPELRSLDRVASDEPSLFAYLRDAEVQEIWEAMALVDAARVRLGAPEAGRCYSLKTHALLQGDYSHDNLCTIPIAELIRFTGDFEQQTRHLPEGSAVQLKVVE